MTRTATIPRVIAVCVSKHKGTIKTPVEAAELTVEHGISGDAHAGPWHRQLSLLAMESIQKMKDLGLEVEPGSFAENVTTEGLDLVSLPIGTRLRIGNGAVVEITQIGKECHTRCAIYYRAGDCVMPKEGVFARIIEGGRIQPGDRILVLNDGEH
ncbi:MAG: MOSC domain-containing protein [Deltaproteobacteria bacterium]|nr:MOSC domain-containing protein [Deltaproteobacteria bacterium]